nr:potassium transporter 8-like [Ipomoea batatas]
MPSGLAVNCDGCNDAVESLVEGMASFTTELVSKIPAISLTSFTNLPAFHQFSIFLCIKISPGAANFEKGSTLHTFEHIHPIGNPSRKLPDAWGDLIISTNEERYGPSSNHFHIPRRPNNERGTAETCPQTAQARTGAPRDLLPGDDDRDRTAESDSWCRSSPPDGSKACGAGTAFYLMEQGSRAWRCILRTLLRPRLKAGPVPSVP